MALQSARGMGRARRTVVAGALALAIALSVAPAAIAEHYEGTIELQGATPVEAAVAFSRAAFPDGALEAALGRDDNFADSLASGVMQNNAPLLLTPTASLAPATDSELKRLGVKTVHILGGPSAVSAAVEQQLVAGGYAVRRHRGATRIDTAVEIARAIVPSASEVLIARAFGSGEDPTQAFADSLAAGAWSASSGSPVLLTETEKLSAPTQTYLQSNKPARASVVGGTSAVSDAVLTQIRALGIEVERVSGPTRFDTAMEINKRRGINSATDTSDIVLLEGQAPGSWAPGFASAAYAAVERAAVLLASGTTLPAPTSAFLDGGTREMGLLCGPQLAAAACDAAAKLLEKRIAPQVVLDQASVAQYANVTGKATPPEEIVSMTASGCGLTDRQVVVNQDGTFSTRIEGAPGTCTLVFKITTRNLGEATKSIPLTVTDPVPATTRPELVKVETATTGAAVATVRFVFSEIVRGTKYDVTGGAATTAAERFLLYGAAGSGQGYKAIDGVPSSTGVPDAGVGPRRDPANNRAVLVDFSKVHYDRATTAAAMEEAADDVGNPPSGAIQESVPGSAPLKEVVLQGARTETDAATDKADLVSVGSFSTQNQPAGKFQATFTFDSDPGTVAASAVGVVLTDSRVIPSEVVTGTGNSRTATFSLSNARTPEGTQCIDGGCPTLQQALTGVRRGYVEITGRPLQSVNVGDGLTSRADLTGVVLDVAGGKADFTFDEPISSADSSKFTLYTVSGDLIPIESASVASNVVRVVAPVTKLVIGASIANGAVTASSGQAAVGGVGIPQTFAAGEYVGPVLVSGSAVLTATTSTTSKTWQVTYSFDQKLDSAIPAAANFLLYTAQGMVGAITECVLFEEKSVRCQGITQQGSAGSDPALLSVKTGAVGLAGAASHKNIEKSVRL